MSDDDTIAEEIRRRRHAKAQAKHNSTRLKENRPRRDDIARAGYYALLRIFNECETRGKTEAAEKLRLTTLQIMTEAGFDRAFCGPMFEEHAEVVDRDARAWIRKRQGERKPAERSAADA